ncbi:MAG: hypothetical protein LBN27_13600 [Prevotellaceae bacterium]|jgi:hypothetical protein|nr:hypothetical protein [Prevotellaceae bacterium]
MINTEHLNWLSNRSREELYFLLEKAHSELNEIEILQKQAEKHRQNAVVIRQKAKEENPKHAGSGWKLLLLFSTFYWVVLIMGVIICGMQQIIQMISKEPSMFLPLLLLICIIPLRKAKQKCKQRKQKFEQQAKDEEARADAKENEAHEKLRNTQYLPLIYEGYCYMLALETMMEFLKKGKADTWKELIDKYDDQYHKWTLEENAAKRLAVQQRQSEIAEETLIQTRKAKNWAAVAAAGVWLRD